MKTYLEKKEKEIVKDHIDKRERKSGIEESSSWEKERKRGNEENHSRNRERKMDNEQRNAQKKK
jgi:hypothetical protein